MAAENLTATIPCYSGLETITVCGVGYCDTSTGNCVCPDGFTGFSDFVTMDETSLGGRVLDCNVSTVAVRILWCLPALVLLRTLVAIPQAISYQTRVFSKLARRDKQKRWYQHPLLLYAWLAAPYTCIDLTTCFIKVFDPNSQLGITVLFSLVWVVGYISGSAINLMGEGFVVRQALMAQATGDAKVEIRKRADKMALRKRLSYTPMMINLLM